MPKKPYLKKILIIGSGPIVIGQAAEFDYAGTQACKAIREEGIETILVNSNPATIMTDKGIADKVYMEPLTEEALEQILAKERPDGILAGFGGQTGLNLAMELESKGILEKYGVALLGVNKESIKRAEDREEFKTLMQDIGEPIPSSVIATSMDECYDFVEKDLRTRLAEQAAVSRKTRRSWSSSASREWKTARSVRSCSKSRLQAGRRSSMKSSETAVTTAS